MIRRTGRAALVLLLCSAVLPWPGCLATQVLSRSWVEVQSEHFTVTSDMDVADAEKLARTLELFRAAVLVITNTRSVESKVPTRVFFFRDEASFRRFQPRRNLAGYFVPGVRANFVAIFDSELMDTERVLRHEYVHFLVRNGSSRVYPPWYDEGFAELLSTASQVGAYVAVGILPEDRIQELARLKWIPLSQILAYEGSPPSPAWEAMFYAESWALLHYLSRDFEHAARLAPSVRTYLDEIEAGAEIDAASQAAFGVGVDELDERLRRYLEAGSFTPIGVRLERLHWSEETHSRVLDRAEAAERLGELCLATARTGHAESLLRAAVAADPTLARAHGALGSALASEEKWSEAEPQLAMALEQGPDDPLNQLDYGEYWLERAQRTKDPSERREWLERARTHLKRALDLDEWKPEPWALYGSSFLVEGEDPSQGVESLEQALQLLPSNVGIQLMLAEAYVAVDRKPGARALLGRILAWSPNDATAQKARELMKRLDVGDGSSP